MANNNNSSSGIGFMSILFIVFLVLKLCKVITWSWWLVTLPLWGGLVLLIIIFVIAAILSVTLERRLRSKTSKSLDRLRKKLKKTDGR